MRIEVEIGSIEIDALPEGTTAEALRASVSSLLEQQIPGARIVANHLPTSHRGDTQRPGPQAHAVESSAASRLATEIGSAVVREIDRFMPGKTAGRRPIAQALVQVVEQSGASTAEVPYVGTAPDKAL